VRRRAATAAIAAASVLGGCGGVKAPDLFIVERTGTVPGARLTLVVNEEGGVRCNGGRTLKLSDPQLVEARAIQEDLHELASKHATLAPGAGSVLSYSLREESGTVRFSDNSSGQPHVLRRLALFVLQTSRLLCHLPL
jgi:predicted HAD superfamily phosphohydrolase